MSASTEISAATSSRLPSGVVVQPRRFEWRDLDDVPQYWFANNPLLTHGENAFSLMIPPGERFFIDSVRHYADRVRDPELKELVRAFVQQEAFHMKAHDTYNESIAKFGIDVEAAQAYAEHAIDRMRKLPAIMQLGATVFLEHLTATGAHTLFTQPAVAKVMHPEMLRFWKWHAAEELEHKAVAFDVFREVGGGYAMRVFSALTALAILAVPFVKLMQRLGKQDGVRPSKKMNAQARDINKQIIGPQLRMIAEYFKPGFHPWQNQDEQNLAAWYAEAGVAEAEAR